MVVVVAVVVPVDVFVVVADGNYSGHNHDHVYERDLPRLARECGVWPMAGVDIHWVHGREYVRRVRGGLNRSKHGRRNAFGGGLVHQARHSPGHCRQGHRSEEPARRAESGSGSSPGLGASTAVHRGSYGHSAGRPVAPSIAKPGDASPGTARAAATPFGAAAGARLRANPSGRTRIEQRSARRTFWLGECPQCGNVDCAHGRPRPSWPRDDRRGTRRRGRSLCSACPFTRRGTGAFRHRSLPALARGYPPAGDSRAAAPRCHLLARQPGRCNRLGAGP